MCYRILDVGRLLISTSVGWVFPCLCWEFYFCPNYGLCKVLVVSSSDCVLLLCSPFAQDWESDFSLVLGLCKVSIVFIVSLGFRFTLVWGCYLVAKTKNVFWGLLLNFFGHARDKNNSGACLTWTVFHLLFGVVTLLSLPSSQRCELFVLLRYVVVGIWSIESRIKGSVCLRKLVFEVTSLAFSLS